MKYCEGMGVVVALGKDMIRERLHNIFGWATSATGAKREARRLGWRVRRGPAGSVVGRDLQEYWVVPVSGRRLKRKAQP